MKKKKILAISPDNYGVGKYRILDPYKYIGENYKDDFHVDITFDAQNNNDYMKNYDIVIFHSFIHKTSHEHNIERIKWSCLSGNTNISEAFFERHLDRVDWSYLSSNTNFKIKL